MENHAPYVIAINRFQNFIKIRKRKVDFIHIVKIALKIIAKNGERKIVINCINISVLIIEKCITSNINMTPDLNWKIVSEGLYGNL